MTQLSNGQAQAVFQSQARAAGIDISGLDVLSQMQIVIASLIGAPIFPGNVTVTGNLAVTGNEVIAGNLTPAADNAGTVGASGMRFAAAYFTLATLNSLTLTGFGSGSGVASVGAADSGGAGFKLIRVPN